MNAVTRLFRPVTKQLMKCKPIAKMMVKISHNEPKILAFSGAGLVIVSFVLAVNAGTKVKPKMEETADKVEKIEAKHKERRETQQTNDENEIILLKAEENELRKARAEGIWEVTKLFILPSGLLAFGLLLMGEGHHILAKKNIVLASALKGTEELFKFYRGNVIEAEGEEADRRYIHGIVGNKEVETYVVDENGKETKIKKNVPVVKNVPRNNPWRFEFSDNYFDSYEDNTERNLYFLQCEESWWNHELDRNGEVSMYEILKHLRYRFEVLKASCANAKEYRERMTFLRNYGWRKNCGGDNFIDFGLFRSCNEPAIQRKSDVVWIEFNCNGNLENLSELN